MQRGFVAGQNDSMTVNRQQSTQHHHIPVQSLRKQIQVRLPKFFFKLILIDITSFSKYHLVPCSHRAKHSQQRVFEVAHNILSLQSLENLENLTMKVKYQKLDFMVKHDFPSLNYHVLKLNLFGRDQNGISSLSN